MFRERPAMCVSRMPSTGKSIVLRCFAAVPSVIERVNTELREIVEAAGTA